MQLGAAAALHAVRRPGPALGGERGVVGRVPVARGHHQVEVAGADQLVHAPGDVLAARHGEGAAGGEVVLEVDDEEGAGDVPIIGRVREYLLTPDEAAAMDAPGSKDAAVLVALYGDPLTAVFTERRADLRRHAGEISFPGGRQDDPAEDLRTTALREAEEEIGLPADAVEIVGALPPVGTFVTGYRVFPFVGRLERRPKLRPQESEVAQILDFSLPALAAGHEMRRLVRKGVPIKTPTYTVDGHLVWGATARIVQSLLERLAPLV